MNVINKLISANIYIYFLSGRYGSQYIYGHIHIYVNSREQYLAINEI